MNLQKLANSAIQFIQPNEEIVLYISLGQANIKGEIKAIYQAPQVMKAQVQVDNDSTLKNEDKTAQSQVSRRFWLNTQGLVIPQGLLRQQERGGDIIKMQDGTYWLVTSAPDNWSNSGWLSLRGILQTIPPDFSASHWQA